MGNPIDVALGRRVEDLRRTRHLSLDRLADITNLPADDIAGYEAGARMPGIALVKIAQALQVDLSSLFLPLVPARGQPGCRHPATPLEGRDLMKNFVGISDPRLRQALIDISDYLTDASRARAGAD